LIDRRMHPERYTKKGGDENLIFWSGTLSL
jgi:hypothetical protein